MSIELPTELNPDVIDAMGELVNMIGGNLKALMPEETTISAPHVLTGKERETLLALRQRISRVCFSVGHDHCCVSLLERSEKTFTVGIRGGGFYRTFSCGKGAYSKKCPIIVDCRGSVGQPRQRLKYSIPIMAVSSGVPGDRSLSLGRSSPAKHFRRS
jgi:hypothetical protein